MDCNLRVDAEHFEYLKIQKGNLDRFAGNFPLWLEHYQADISATYRSILPHLPKTCARFLDVGSGLGGVDVLIRRHYQGRGQDPTVHLLDGEEDPPVMYVHRRTFNHMVIARNFQVKNGLSPLALITHKPTASGFERPFDLVVSFGSWCFHYPPAEYLELLERSGLHAGSVVILDVRSNKPEYFEELERVLEVVTHVVMKPKWSRVVFRVKKNALS
jgi:SAM-dependent methyltransferase